MMLSVALCTYNGADYIDAQLKSILDQTHPVDEIVVCDDGSTDETIKIIESIREENSSVITLYKNPQTLGFKENFFNAIRLCHGDVVFLCDQDDIWYPNKVETIAKWFENHPERNVVFTDASLIDGDGKVSNDCLWQKFGFDKLKQKYLDHGYGLDVWAWCNRATGATMAFRKEYFNGIDWNSLSDRYHDKLIALCAIIDHCIGYICTPLIYYRLHPDQSCGVATKMHELFLSPLSPCPKSNWDFDPSLFPERVHNHLSFLEKRSSLKDARCMTIVKYIPTYIREYGHWAYKFFFFDLILSLKHRIKNRRSV